MKAVAYGQTANGWATASKASKLDDHEFNLFRAVARGLKGAWRDGLWVFPCPAEEVKAAFSAAGFQERKARRGPQSPVEEWARSGLALVAGMDPDHAREENGVGFSKFDGAIGHDLAEKAQGDMSDAQWALAVKLARKYRRQIGPEPKEPEKCPCGNPSAGSPSTNLCGACLLGAPRKEEVR